MMSLHYHMESQKSFSSQVLSFNSSDYLILIKLMICPSQHYSNKREMQNVIFLFALFLIILHVNVNVFTFLARMRHLMVP